MPDLIPSEPSPTRSTVTVQVGGLASPLAMMLIIPLLVLVCGLTVGLITRTALYRSVETTAATALFQSSERTKREIVDSLEQSGPVLDALRAWARSKPDLSDHGTVARTLLAIAHGRPGVAIASISTPDGDFQAVEQRDHQWTYVHTSMGPDGSTPRNEYSFTIDRQLNPERRIGSSGFDPRQRPFYLAATRTRARTWTDPYPFFNSGVTGITCAEPVADPQDPAARLVGVVAVDFDLESLGGVLEQIDAQFSSHSFLFTSEHVLVGLPNSWRPAQKPDAPRQLLTVQNLRQPLLNAYVAALPALPRSDQPQAPFAVQVDGVDLVAAVSAVPIPNHGPTWYVGMLLPRERLMGGADRDLRLSFILGLLVLACSTGVAWWFARHLTRSRVEATTARARAREAEASLRELGSYQLVKLLGKGGMGEVWLAQHRMLARPAAIKLIKAETLEGRDAERREEIRKRFTAEARITANLRSRSTIELYDYGITDDGTFYYVMELLEGIDLYDLVGKHGRLTPARVVHLLMQACHSLAEAHDRGLVHRDIKPENLFICRRADEVDVLKVLDFGIVRMQQPTNDMAKTRQGLVQGTPATMSPEQATDQPLDGRSDLYSLGCVAYWLLTGHQVFNTDGAMELLTNHVQTPPIPPSQRIHQPLPPALEKIVMACLAKDPEQRPRNARVLAQLLMKAELPGCEPWDEAHMNTWWELHLPARPLPVADSGASQVFSPKRLPH
jgi:serine/threonine protein kinase